MPELSGWKGEPWYKCHLCLLCPEPICLSLSQQGTWKGHSRLREGAVEGEQRGPSYTLQSPAQLLGEEDNSQLALTVSSLGVILPLLPVQVIEVYVPSNMCQG